MSLVPEVVVEAYPSPGVVLVPTGSSLTRAFEGLALQSATLAANVVQHQQGWFQSLSDGSRVLHSAILDMHPGITETRELVLGLVALVQVLQQDVGGLVADVAQLKNDSFVQGQALARLEASSAELLAEVRSLRSFVEAAAVQAHERMVQVLGQLDLEATTLRRELSRVEEVLGTEVDQVGDQVLAAHDDLLSFWAEMSGLVGQGVDLEGLVPAIVAALQLDAREARVRDGVGSELDRLALFVGQCLVAQARALSQAGTSEGSEGKAWEQEGGLAVGWREPSPQVSSSLPAVTARADGDRQAVTVSFGRLVRSVPFWPLLPPVEGEEPYWLTEELVSFLAARDYTRRRV